MSKDSVKFLNEECLASIGARISLHHVQNIPPGEVERIAKDMLAKQFGYHFIDQLPIAQRDDLTRNEREYSAEAYVLTVPQVQVLYRLMREELRNESCTKGEKELLEEIDELKDTIDALDAQLAEAKGEAKGE